MTKKNWKSDQPCVACGSETENGISWHHLFTRGTYPEFQDEEWNKMPLCDLNHHVPGVHQKGLIYMAENFPSVKKWLIDHEWYFCEFNKKWRREGF